MMNVKKVAGVKVEERVIRIRKADAHRIATAISCAFDWSQQKYPELWSVLAQAFDGTGGTCRNVDEMLEENTSYSRVS